MKTINALLVKFSITYFPNTRQDRAITEEVRIRKALGQGAGKWMKTKLPEDALDEIKQLAGQIRQFHYDHTAPWDDGYRLLSSKAHDAYRAGIEEMKARYFALVDEFGQRYRHGYVKMVQGVECSFQSYVDQAKVMHGPTFDQADYPAWPEAQQMFKLSTEFYPVPNAQHFNSEMKQVYGEALEEHNQQRINDAVHDIWRRLIEPVQHMAEKLSDPKGCFRDTLVENIKDMVKLVPMLNLTADAKLADAAREIGEKLANMTPEQLREDKIVRKDVAEKAKELASRFGNLGGRKLITD